MAKFVKFSDVNEVPYGCFSVLSPHPIIVRHIQYPSVQHYVLCETYKGSPYEEKIRVATSLWEVDRHRRQADLEGHQREDWEKIKTDVMLLGCYYKFKQNPDAQVILLQTGNKVVVNQDPKDGFWGDGGGMDSSGKPLGKNLLGVILMSVRKRLLAEEKQRKEVRPTRRR